MNVIQRFIYPAVYLLLLTVTSATASFAQESSNESLQKEKELLAVLRSDAPAAEKAITCKRLAIYGSSAAIGDLAKLLPDPQLSSWARIAIEAIPGSESDDALLKAAGTLEGKLLVGMINSIGVRRSENAVDLLTTQLRNTDVEVASAAAVALGRIGNAAATESLRSALSTSNATVRSAVAEGAVLCAERLHAGGKSAEAVAIYDAVSSADVPQQRIIEATRGAILARKQGGIRLLMELFRSPDTKMFQLALGTVREFPGDQIDKLLGVEIANATPERGALIVQAMADRPNTVDLAALLKLTTDGNVAQPVRLAAIVALGGVGDGTCLEPLLDVAMDKNAELAEAAQTTLAELQGENIDSQIVGLLPSATEKTYPLLIEIVGQRRIEATDVLLDALSHSDQSVRESALVALGETVSLEKLPVLVSQVIKPKHSEDAAAAQRALKVASIRMPDRAACASVLASALTKAPATTKSVLLEILGEVGGAKSLEIIGSSAKSDDRELQDTASRVLGKWNGLEAAPVLLDLASNAPSEKYQIRALRGYIGLIRKFAMPDNQRIQMSKNALNAARRTAEQELVFSVLQLHPSKGGLELAIIAAGDANLKDAGRVSTLVIAQKLGAKKIDVTDMLSDAGFEKVKLEITKAEYGSGASQKDVTAVLQKQVGDLPLIALPASSYSASFGGETTPGEGNHLKIDYRMNGKSGQASFAEDEVIILPMPK